MSNELGSSTELDRGTTYHRLRKRSTLLTKARGMLKDIGGEAIAVGFISLTHRQGKSWYDPRIRSKDLRSGLVSTRISQKKE